MHPCHGYFGVEGSGLCKVGGVQMRAVGCSQVIIVVVVTASTCKRGSGTTLDQRSAGMGQMRTHDLRAKTKSTKFESIWRAAAHRMLHCAASIQKSKEPTQIDTPCLPIGDSSALPLLSPHSPWLLIFNHFNLLRPSTTSSVSCMHYAMLSGLTSCTSALSP